MNLQGLRHVLMVHAGFRTQPTRAPTAAAALASHPGGYQSASLPNLDATLAAATSLPAPTADAATTPAASGAEPVPPAQPSHSGIQVCVCHAASSNLIGCSSASVMLILIHTCFFLLSLSTSILLLVCQVWGSGLKLSPANVSICINNMSAECRIVTMQHR